ncbi:unnamed protein product [Urochloa humidicola]
MLLSITLPLLILISLLDALTEQPLLRIYNQKQSSKQTQEVLLQGLHQLHQSLSDIVNAALNYVRLMAVVLEKLASLESFNQQKLIPPILVQLVFHVGHSANCKSISPMHLPRKMWRCTLASFHYENYKLQQITSAIRTFWEEVDLAKSTKEGWQMVH